MLFLFKKKKIVFNVYIEDKVIVLVTKSFSENIERPSVLPFVTFRDARKGDNDFPDELRRKTRPSLFRKFLPNRDEDGKVDIAFLSFLCLLSDPFGRFF